MTGDTKDGPAAAEFRKGWPVLLAATLGSAVGLSTLPFYSLGSFIGPLQGEFGWGRGDIASSFLYTTVVLAIVAPFLGLLVDRIGVRPVALVSIPLFSGVLVLLGLFSGSLGTFHLLFALAALVGGGATPINYTRAVNASFDRARGIALGISLAGIGVAAIALPILLSHVNSTYGWRTGFLTLAALALVPWPFVLLGLRTPPPQRQEKAGVAARDALRTGVFWTMALSFAGVAIAVSALIVHMTPLLRDAGQDAMSAARTTSLVGIGVLAGRIGIGWLIDRIFAPHVAGAMFATTAAGCLLLAAGGPGMAPVAALAVGLSLGAEVDLMAYLTARYFGMARYAFVYGIIYSLFALGGAAGPALAGAAFDLRGSYDLVVWAVVLLLLAAAAAIARLPRFDRHPTPGEPGDGAVIAPQFAR